MATMTVREALEALEAWAKSKDRTHIHYGLEAIKRGTRAVLDGPSADSLNLDAELNYAPTTTGG